MKKVFRILVNVLISLFLILALVIAVPNLLGMRTVAVSGDDMHPTVPAGSLVLVEKATFAGIEEEDVIAFRAVGAAPEVQRVVEVIFAPPGYVTWGDGLASENPIPVPYENVLGVARIWIPLLGFVLVFVSGVPGKIIAGGILLVLIALFFLLGKGKEGKAAAGIAAAPADEAATPPAAEPVVETAATKPVTEAAERINPTPADAKPAEDEIASILAGLRGGGGRSKRRR